MKRHEDTALDAEERALAAQLRRLPPHGEPDADLDARILAMARSAAQPRAAMPSRRHHWPAYASAAAVCVLAAGLAWQLWPAHVQRNERAAEPASAPVPAPPAPVAIIAPPKEIVTEPQDSVAAESAADTAAPRETARAVALPPQPPRPAPSIPPTPQPVVQSANETAASPQPAQMPATAGVIAPPPAPPAPPAPPPPPASAPPQPASIEPAEAKTAAPATMKAMRVQSAADTENGYDARPPATVQDSSVRTDWLKRIRELMAQGDRDGARHSLQEYKSRYPDAVIPNDLQPLLATPPPKSP